MGNSFNNWKNKAGRDVNIQINQDPPEKVATYEPEPIWRSPITMAVLSWTSPNRASRRRRHNIQSAVQVFRY